MPILHVEDHESTRDVVRCALKAHGIAVLSVDGVSAAKRAIAGRTDVTGALVDLRLPDGSGLELYEWLTTHRPELAARVAFVSGGGTELAQRVAAIGRPVLSKPFELADVVRLAAKWEGCDDRLYDTAWGRAPGANGRES
jgi:two-component system, NtrC family, response regulator PilR